MSYTARPMPTTSYLLVMNLRPSVRRFDDRRTKGRHPGRVQFELQRDAIAIGRAGLAGPMPAGDVMHRGRIAMFERYDHTPGAKAFLHPGFRKGRTRGLAIGPGQPARPQLDTPEIACHHDGDLVQAGAVNTVENRPSGRTGRFAVVVSTFGITDVPCKAVMCGIMVRPSFSLQQCLRILFGGRVRRDRNETGSFLAVLTPPIPCRHEIAIGIAVHRSTGQ